MSCSKRYWRQGRRSQKVLTVLLALPARHFEVTRVLSPNPRANTGRLYEPNASSQSSTSLTTFLSVPKARSGSRYHLIHLPSLPHPILTLCKGLALLPVPGSYPFLAQFFVQPRSRTEFALDQIAEMTHCSGQRTIARTRTGLRGKSADFGRGVSRQAE